MDWCKLDMTGDIEGEAIAYWQGTIVVVESDRVDTILDRVDVNGIFSPIINCNKFL